MQPQLILILYADDIVILLPLFQVIGLGILCALLTTALIKWMKCFVRKSGCCSRELDYYKLILEEEENVLKEILTTAAKEKLTNEIQDKLRNDKWTECFDVAEELINKNAKPFDEAERKVMNLHLLPPCWASCLCYIHLDL